MSNLRNKIILEGMVSAPSVAAWVTGTTVLLGGWAVGSVLVVFGGAALVGAGAAWSLTSLALRYDSIKSKVMKQMRDETRADRDKRLDELDERLLEDRDPRDQNALRDLRSMLEQFEAYTDQGKIPIHLSSSLVDKVRDLFDKCVHNLEICYNLWATSRELRDTPKQQMMEKREEVLQEVLRSVDSFSKVVTSVMTLTWQNNDLSGLTEQLDEELAICLRVEERLRNDLDNPATNPDYAEYDR